MPKVCQSTTASSAFDSSFSVGSCRAGLETTAEDRNGHNKADKLDQMQYERITLTFCVWVVSISSHGRGATPSLCVNKRELFIVRQICEQTEIVIN